MGKNHAIAQHIKQALELGGNAQAIKNYYQKWSQTYNSDLLDDHVAPQHLVLQLDAWLQQHRPSLNKANTQLMDIGCGTGLVGPPLIDAGFSLVDGVDLSPHMIEQARRLNIYRELTGDVDINLEPLAKWQQQYDIVLCCGVLTLGHVAPESLLNMAKFAKPGGVLLVTTRLAYYEKTHFQAVSDLAERNGLLQCKQCVKNAPYTNDSDAHYWLYEVR